MSPPAPISPRRTRFARNAVERVAVTPWPRAIEHHSACRNARMEAHPVHRVRPGVAPRLAGVDLPLVPPVRPMLAKASDALPDAPVGDYWFEPKWDGFRCIVFRDGDDVVLG